VIDASPFEFQFVKSPEPIPKGVPRHAFTVPPPAEPITPADPATEPARASNPPLPAGSQKVEPTPRPRAPERQAPKVERPASPMFSTYYPAEEPTWKTRLLWLAFTLAVFGFGAVAGYEYAGGEIPPLRAAAPASAELKKTPADPYNVNLTATAKDQSILVRWDHDSEAVKTAMRGVLTVTEGGVSKQVKLDFPELRNGIVLYHKAGTEVGFKLELFFKENRVLAENVTLRMP
jgi:hypothetical protein